MSESPMEVMLKHRQSRRRFIGVDPAEPGTDKTAAVVMQMHKAGMVSKQAVIAQAIDHRQPRRELARAMAEPIRGPNKNGDVFVERDSRPCTACGRYWGRHIDECDELPIPTDVSCWRPPGCLLVFDEKLE